MLLSSIVDGFATEEFTDYNDALSTFRGLLHVQVDASGSGNNTTRRVLELPATQTLPDKREFISEYGMSFVAGHKLTDQHQELIRTKYPLLLTHSHMDVGTTGQVLANTHIVGNILAKLDYRGTKGNEKQTSELFLEYDIRFSSAYTTKVGDICRAEGKYYRIVSPPFLDGAGFNTCTAFFIEDPLQTLTYTTKDTSLAVYNVANDTYSQEDKVTPCFVEDFRVNYSYISPDFHKVESGDKAISFLKTAVASAKAGDVVGDYRVLSVYEGSNYFTVQARRK